MSQVIIAGDTSGTITLQAPAASGSSVLTLPVATDTLVGKATTDTLTNKTLTAPVLSGTATGTYTLAGTPTITSPTITGASITLAASAAPAFSATSSAGTAMTNATYVKVTFDTERFDTNSNFASSRFTPTVAGYYQVNTHLVYLCSTVTQIVLAFYKNGVVDTYTNLLPYVANASSINCSYIVQMNGSTDYLEVFFYIAGTGSLSAQGGPQTIFNGAMIRSA